VVFEARYDSVLFHELQAHVPQLDRAARGPDRMAWVKNVVTNHCPDALDVNRHPTGDCELAVYIERDVKDREKK